MTTRKLTSAAAILGRRGGSAGTPAQLAQRRAAAVRGGRPVATFPEVRYATYGGTAYRVTTDGDVLVWDSVAGHYTACHSISPSLAGRIRSRARGPEGRTSDR